MATRAQFALTEELRRAHAVLGLEPGVSPLGARRRYRQLVKQWHPGRHTKDGASQANATRRTQEVIGIVVAVFGWRILEWFLRKLWWLA